MFKKFKIDSSNDELDEKKGKRGRVLTNAMQAAQHVREVLNDIEENFNVEIKVVACNNSNECSLTLIPCGTHYDINKDILVLEVN
jgi:hypothetical protein